MKDYYFITVNTSITKITKNFVAYQLVIEYSLIIANND